MLEIITGNVRASKRHGITQAIYGMDSKEAANASIPGHSEGREDM